MSALPRLSMLIAMSETALRIRISQGGVTIEELNRLAQLLRHFEEHATHMERLLDAHDPKPIPEGGNVVAFAKPAQPKP